MCVKILISEHENDLELGNNWNTDIGILTFPPVSPPYGGVGTYQNKKIIKNQPFMLEERLHIKMCSVNAQKIIAIPRL